MKPTKSSSMCVNALGTSLVWFCNHNDIKKETKMPSEVWCVQGAHFMDKFYLVGKMNYDS